MASTAKNFHGIIEQLHFLSAETSGIAERAVRRAREETSAVLKQSESDEKSDSRILWNAIAVWEMTKTSWQTGNLKMNKDLENPSWTGFVRGGIWDEDILIAEIEDLEKLDASEICPRRPNAKEVLITQKDGEFICLMADGSAKLSGRN